MPWIMTESPLAIETVFEVGDATGSKSRAPAGIPMREMPMMNRHAQLIIRHIGFFVMVHFQYVYDGFREKNLFVLPRSGSSRKLMIRSRSIIGFMGSCTLQTGIK